MLRHANPTPRSCQHPAGRGGKPPVIKGDTVSTIGEEKQFNPRLSAIIRKRKSRRTKSCGSRFGARCGGGENQRSPGNPGSNQSCES
jgi:hypothetical protein